jgi:hypothetical protein
MKTKQYNNILRSEYPKWNGWKILDFYSAINVSINPTECRVIQLLQVLEENFYLVKELEILLRSKIS